VSETRLKQHRDAERRYRSLFENSPIVVREEDFSAGKRELDRIAEVHGWRVSVTESESGGARFEVVTDPVCSPGT